MSAAISGTAVPHVATLMRATVSPHARHCERSEAIQNLRTVAVWIVSSQELLAMTRRRSPLHAMRDQLLHEACAFLQLRHFHEFVRCMRLCDRAGADHDGRDIGHAGEQACLGA